MKEPVLSLSVFRYKVGLPDAREIILNMYGKPFEWE